MSKTNLYEVTVGNIGRVYSGHSLSEAKEIYNEYKLQSFEGYGRAADEEVVLWENSEPVTILSEVKDSRNEYRKLQFANVKTSHDGFNIRVKFIEVGSTKWMDISNSEFEAIKKLLTT